jgi:hypothetical protein
MLQRGKNRKMVQGRLVSELDWRALLFAYSVSVTSYVRSEGIHVDPDDSSIVCTKNYIETADKESCKCAHRSSVG